MALLGKKASLLAMYVHLRKVCGRLFAARGSGKTIPAPRCSRGRSDVLIPQLPHPHPHKVVGPKRIPLSRISVSGLLIILLEPPESLERESWVCGAVLTVAAKSVVNSPWCQPQR